MLYYVAAALVVLWVWRDTPSYVWATEYSEDDWGWLLRGRSPASFAEHVLNPSGLFRPLFHSLYFFSYQLFGLDARPLAVLLAGAWCVTGAATIYAVALAGIAGPIAALAVLSILGALPMTDALAQVSFHAHTLSRLVIAGTCIVFLRGEPRTRVWLTLLLTGYLIHEQSIAAAPIMLSFLCFRDGIPSILRRLSATGALRNYCIAFAVVTALRVTAFFLVEGSGGTHAPALSNIPNNLRELQPYWRGFLPAWGLLLFVPLGLGAIASKLCGFRRILALSIAIFSFGYAPYLQQGAYFASYFANLAILGIGVALAWAALAGVEHDLSSPKWQLRLRAIFIAVLTLFWVGRNPTLPQRQTQGVGTRIHAILAPIIPTSVGENTVEVLIAGPPAENENTHPAYIRAIGGLEYGRSSFFELFWPGIHFRFKQVSLDDVTEHLPLPCELVLLATATRVPESPWDINVREPFECP